MYEFHIASNHGNILYKYEKHTHKTPDLSPTYKKYRSRSFFIVKKLWGFVISCTGGPVSLKANLTISSLVLSPWYVYSWSPFKLQIKRYCYMWVLQVATAKENRSTHNRIVGNPLTLNAFMTLVNLVQSTRPTLIGVACKCWATWDQTGSNLLQCAHHGAYI